MVNKRNWLGILVMVLVFGMTVVGCEMPTEDDTWSKLIAGSGKWKHTESGLELIFSGSRENPGWGWDNGVAIISISENIITYGGGIGNVTVTFITDKSMTLSDMTFKGGGWQKLEGTYNRVP